MPKRANKSPEPTGNEKPKRPLSGYNLFYRFKRNKILEANAASSSANQYPSLTEDDERAQIDSILKATPGLEGLPPNHIAFTYAPADLNEFRSQQIRSAMEGKLFPNENARNRLHRKVHGMGFVEMGRIMRDMWAGIDGFTKGIFCELADVGRVRYHTLLAEYKKGLGENDGSSSTPKKKKVKSSAAEKVKALNKAKKMATKKVESASVEKVTKANRAEAVEQVKKMYNPKASMSSFSSGAPSSSSGVSSAVHQIVETPKVQEKPSVMSFISPVPSQANLPRFVQNNTTVLSANNGVVRPSVFEDTVTYSVPTMAAGMPHRHVSAAQEPKYGRRVSTSELSITSAVGMANSTASTPSLTEMNAHMRAYQEVNQDFRSLLQNAMLPLPLYNQEMNSNTMMVPSSSSSINDECNMMFPEIPSSSSCDDIAEEDAEDFLDFLGKIDDALDNNDIDHGDTMMCNAIKRPSMIFGKPIHDVATSSYPLPADYELNNARARMA